jgi:hypothetical protein
MGRTKTSYRLKTQSFNSGKSQVTSSRSGKRCEKRAFSIGAAGIRFVLIRAERPLTTLLRLSSEQPSATLK